MSVSKEARVSRRCGRRRGDDEAGFALVEIIAATVILMVIVVSLSNLLVDSLTATLMSRQREAAASIASDTVENARALGQTALTAASVVSDPTCPVSNGTALTNVSPVPALAQATMLVPYTTTLDGTTFTVCSNVTASTTSADTVSVMVTWAAGAHSYLTSSQVGS
jgi:Tfp pilus assembly protein PilV